MEYVHNNGTNVKCRTIQLKNGSKNGMYAYIIVVWKGQVVLKMNEPMWMEFFL